MTKGKIIFTCVGCFSLGFIGGWAARELVKKKDKELKEDNCNMPKEIHVDFAKDRDHTVNEDRIINDYICKRYRQGGFSVSEKEAIEQANAEAESPSEDEEEDPETDPDYAEDYSSAPYDPDDDYDDYKPQTRYDQFAEDEDDDEEDVPVRKKNIWPYEISVDEFEEDNGFSKSTLEYYKNNVLIDEDGDEITNPGSIIGSGVLKNLLVSKDTAYVRNESLEIDYEIAYVGENYEGYDLEDDEY